MLISQVLVTFETIRRFPGLTIEELADKMREFQPSSIVVEFLVGGGGDHYLLKSRIRELACVEIVDRKYYIDSNSESYSKDEIINHCLSEYMKTKTSKNNFKNNLD